MAAAFTCSNSAGPLNHPVRVLRRVRDHDDCMLNAISIAPGSPDEVTSSDPSTSCDVDPVNRAIAHGRGHRTFLTSVNSFFTELKRRNVYKVAAAYAVGSWLLIQVASIFLPTFNAPPCMMREVVVFLAVGFIVSAVLSWIFDITPQGIKRTADFSPDAAANIVRQLETRARQEFVRGYLSALIYAGTGDKTKAIDYLQHEYFDLEQHNNIDPAMSVDAMLDQLRTDPRFQFLSQPQ